MLRVDCSFILEERGKPGKGEIFSSVCSQRVLKQWQTLAPQHALLKSVRRRPNPRLNNAYTSMKKKKKVPDTNEEQADLKMADGLDRLRRVENTDTSGFLQFVEIVQGARRTTATV